MGLTLDKVVFDTTQLDDSANVGAFLRSSDGTLLTHTTVSGKQALDVNLVNGPDDGFFTEDQAHSSGDVGQYVLNVRQDTLASSTDVSGDYQSFKSDALGRLYVNKSAQNSAYGVNAAITTTAALIIPSALANRTKMILQNVSNREVYIGTTNSVTVANGLRLSPGGSIELEVGPQILWYGITASGTADIRYLEVA